MDDVLQQAIATYGKDMQLNVAIEEFSELTKEICKHKRGADNTLRIIEEIADCYIMLKQLEMMFDINVVDLAKEIDRKIERLNRRLSSEQIRKEYEGK